MQPRASCRSVLSALGGRLKTKFSKSSLHRELINHKKKLHELLNVPLSYILNTGFGDGVGNLFKNVQFIKGV